MFKAIWNSQTVFKDELTSKFRNSMNLEDVSFVVSVGLGEASRSMHFLAKDTNSRLELLRSIR
jgi:hypothetical protein